jgi:hypothetical protein
MPGTSASASARALNFLPQACAGFAVVFQSEDICLSIIRSELYLYLILSVSVSDTDTVICGLFYTDIYLIRHFNE